MLNKDTKRLALAIMDYRQWVESLEKRQGREPAMRYGQILFDFLNFVIAQDLRWEQMFTYSTVEAFRGQSGATGVAQALMALGTFLHNCGRLDQPIAITKPQEPLPEIYEQYLSYLEEVRELSDSHVRSVRVVLSDFHAYLLKHDLDLVHVKIDDLDAFMATYKVAEITRDLYRYCLRGFLKYLYYDRQILKRNLAAMIVHPPRFAQSKLPKFLRPEQIQRLFDSLTLDTPAGIRTAAMVHLAFYLGLRPVEISRIRLDDISFEKGELAVPDRKTKNPVTLPLPEHTLKTIGVYINGVRPQNEFRELFLSFTFPYRPASAVTVGRCIRQAMRKAGIPGSAYWLRHTYAQCLLNQRASIYEIKEMLGHQSIQSSQRYLRVNVALMRKVLFDETL